MFGCKGTWDYQEMAREEDNGGHQEMVGVEDGHAEVYEGESPLTGGYPDTLGGEDAHFTRR